VQKNHAFIKTTGSSVEPLASCTVSLVSSLAHATVGVSVREDADRIVIFVLTCFLVAAFEVVGARAFSFVVDVWSFVPGAISVIVDSVSVVLSVFVVSFVPGTRCLAVWSMPVDSVPVF